MNNPHAPTLGATSSCPCNLSSIKPSLQALASKAKASGGQLTPTQAQLFGELCDAWEYYRDSQLPGFRAVVDVLVDAIGDLPVAADDLMRAS